MVRCLAFIAVSIFLVAPSRATAAITGFSFSGEIAHVIAGGDPFDAGFTVDPQTLVSGRILYDTNSAPLPPVAGCDCLIYPQHLPGGISATFGNVSLHADDYFVHVKNNLSGKDTISIYNALIPFDNPALVKPLWVGGIQYPNAWFNLDLTGASTTFSDPSLPPTLDVSLFNSLTNILDEVAAVPGQIDLLFRNESMSSLAFSLGDYDFSGNVEQDDYHTWSKVFGGASDLDAVGNNDGVVDAADYVVWRKFTSSSPASATVAPEPGALAIAILALLAASPRCLQRRCRN